MIDLLLEGVQASVQPCSLALLLPALGAVVLAGRRGWIALLGVWAAAAGLAWAQASLLLDVSSDGGWTGVILALIALLGLTVQWLTRGGSGRRARMAAGLGGLLIGVAAGLLWRPCVGPALGVLLTAAPRGPGGQLLPLLVYMAGLLAIALLVAMLPLVNPALGGLVRTTPARVVAITPLVMLSVVLATGQYDRIIGALVQLSRVG